MASEDENDATPTGPARRSGRERKEPERLADSQANNKSKKSISRTNGAESDSEDDPDDFEEEESEDDFEAPKQSQAKGGRKSAGGKKAVPAAASQKKRAPRKKKDTRANGADGDEEEGGANTTIGKGDYKISDDNNIFNALRNPNSSLQQVVDEWIESYEKSTGLAMAELVNFVLRYCGCNASIDEHQAEDDDGIVDVLDGIQTDFKEATALAYPLISKAKGYKKFRSSLTTFLSKLFHSAAAAADVLYEDTFCTTFQSWLTSLSSSKLRSFRHTATVVALYTISALGEVVVGVNKEFSQASRAQEAEEKKGRKDKARLKDLTKNVEEVHERKTKLEEYLKDLFDSVFVHRYRDSDPIIRSECIKALGGWMKTHPDYYIDGDFLRYLGWVLSDTHKEARQESVKALISLYAKEDHIGSMQHFTERFKGQLVSMAVNEVDMNVRISCIHVLRQIEKHGLLEEGQRDDVAKLVYEEEKRIRLAVAAFVEALLESLVEEKAREFDITEDDKLEQLRFKCLAELLVKYGKLLDGVETGEEDDMDGSEESEEYVESVKTHRDRVALAVEALWDSVDAVQRWKSMLEYLLLDHSEVSAEGGQTSKTKKGKKAKKAAASGDLEETCRLSEEEETLLISVLTASLTKVTHPSASSKKDKDKEVDTVDEVTQALIDALPRLFAKHQTFPLRVVDILSFPCLMNLDLYLDSNKVTDYETLWDNITKQFTTHTDARVIDQAVKTIRVFLDCATLAGTNDTQIFELEESLVTSLRLTVEGKSIESAAFEEEELVGIRGWIVRISKLFDARDISPSLDETDDGKLSSAWEIIDSLTERGRLGYQDEASMVQHSLKILEKHLYWKTKTFADDSNEVVDGAELAAIHARMTTLLERLEEFCVGTTANAADIVKQESLVLLLQIHILCAGLTSAEVDPDGRLSELKVECSEELQARCAGFVEAEIDRYATFLEDAKEDDEESDEEDEEDGGDSDDSDAARKKKKAKKSKAKKPKPVVKKLTPAELRAKNVKEQEALVVEGHFLRMSATFVAAIYQNIVDLSHSSVILMHYQKFGSTFDSFIAIIGEALREEGLYGNLGETVTQVIIDTLQGAYDLYFQSSDSSDDRLLALSRALSGITVVRGAQFAVVKRLHSDDLVRIHTDLIDFVIKKVATFEEGKKKESRTKAISIFKALSNLVLGLDGRSAFKVKNALDSAVERADISVGSKHYEPLRGYQKRLITSMSKDPALKAAAAAKTKGSTPKTNGKGRGKGKGKGKASQQTDDEEGDDDSDNENDSDPAPAKPRSPRKFRTTTAAVSGDDEDEDVLPSRHNTTKRAAPKAKGSPAKKRKLAKEPSPVESEEEEQIEEDEEDEEMDVDEEDEVVASLLSSPDKQRSQENDPVASQADSVASLSDVKKNKRRARC